MDVEYIRLLMLYSDMKYPYQKAKADPGLSEGLRSTGRFLKDHGTRRITAGEANRVMLMERQAKHAELMKQRHQPDSLNERDTE